MSSFNTPDESVQDTVAQLINQAANTDVVYNDANDTLTVSLTDSVSVNTLEANKQLNGADFTTATEGQALLFTDNPPNLEVGEPGVSEQRVKEIALQSDQGFAPEFSG